MQKKYGIWGSGAVSFQSTLSPCAPLPSAAEGRAGSQRGAADKPRAEPPEPGTASAPAGRSLTAPRPRTPRSPLTSGAASWPPGAPRSMASPAGWGWARRPSERRLPPGARLSRGKLPCQPPHGAGAALRRGCPEPFSAGLGAGRRGGRQGPSETVKAPSRLTGSPRSRRPSRVGSARSETFSQGRCSRCSSAPAGESCQRARTASEVLSTPRESCLLPKFLLNSGAPAVRLRAGSRARKRISRQRLRSPAKHAPGWVCTDPLPGATGASRTPRTSRAGSSVHIWTGTVVSLPEASGLQAGIQEDVEPFDASVCSGSAHVYHAAVQTGNTMPAIFVFLITRTPSWTSLRQVVLGYGILFARGIEILFLRYPLSPSFFKMTLCLVSSCFLSVFTPFNLFTVYGIIHSNFF